MVEMMLTCNYRNFGKRCLDLVLASIFLIIALPVGGFIFFLIMALYGKPVLFNQRRIGRNGEPFLLYKFRTLKDQRNLAESEIPRLCARLRHCALDEIPSFINIFFGHISLVGPRPLMLIDYESLREICPERFLTKPGLTGLAQISGRNRISWRRRLMYDLRYSMNPSLGKDISVLLRTMVVLLFSDPQPCSRLVSGVRLARELQR